MVVYRHTDVSEGRLYVLSDGTTVWPDPAMTSAVWYPPGIYVGQTDTRSDDEIRQWLKDHATP